MNRWKKKLRCAGRSVGFALAFMVIGNTVTAQSGRNIPFLPASNTQTVIRELLVSVKPGSDIAALTREYGLQVVRRLRSDGNRYVLRASSSLVAQIALAKLTSDGRILRVYRDSVRPRTRFDFVPNDPYFYVNTPASGFPGQWYLFNPVTPGLDSGVMGAWQRDITGQGVVIGIVDDGLQTDHPDLIAAYHAADSYDFGQFDTDPDPVSYLDRHGTAVAGVAAARGGNGIGIAGTAPFAGLAGLRVDFDFSPDSAYADATLYHSSGDNTTIKVKNHSYGYSNPYIDATPEWEALAISASAGTIHCYAAGNLRGSSAEDSNKLQEQSSPDVICVAALGDNGQFASYSDFGACVFVTAPSSNPGGLNVTTTDRMGDEGFNTSEFDSDPFPDLDYTSIFGGTSSASPLVAGVMALGKQVQPALNLRFAKHLLSQTSTPVDLFDTTGSSDGGWKTNAAGLKFNQNYGFGLINADAFTRQAVRYSGVTSLQTVTTGVKSVNAAIPDNSVTGISRTFVVNTTTPMEETLVTLDIAHTGRGQLEATLTSPRGTTSRLFRSFASDNGSGINWTFCTNAFWGENPQGTWTLTVKDIQASKTGTWNSYQAELRMGRLLGQTFSGKVHLEDAVNLAQTITFEFRPLPSGVAFTRTVNLKASGEFTLADLPAGSYNVAIKGAKWLRKVVPLNLSTGSVIDFAVFLRAGDADNSNSVDVFDLDLLIQHFDECTDNPADFNCDGCTDVLDLDLLIRNFDSQGDA